LLIIVIIVVVVIGIRIAHTITVRDRRVLNDWRCVVVFVIRDERWVDIGLVTWVNIYVVLGIEGLL
jgi:hypothetical protein